MPVPISRRALSQPHLASAHRAMPATPQRAAHCGGAGWRGLHLRTGNASRARSRASLRTVHLPDGSDVQAFDRNEALFLWDEVFRSQCYLKPRLVDVRAGDTVIDVGAALIGTGKLLPEGCQHRHSSQSTDNPYATAACVYT